MLGWIFFQRDLDPALPEVPEILRFQEAAAARGVELHVLKPHNFDIVAAPVDGWSVHYEGHSLARPDFILCRTGAETDYFTLAVLRHFERRGVRLINGPEAIDLVADKLHTMQRLARAGLPIPATILGKFPMDVDIVEDELGFPVIVKTLRGTRGTGVLKCEDRSQFEDLAGLLASADAKADFLFQHYVRSSHGRDVRVLVIGGRVIAAMERRSPAGHFKSNVSLGGVGIAYTPTGEMADLAARAADTLGLEIAGIDILFDNEGYRICEANSAPGFQGLERACSIDVPNAIFDWIEASHEAQERPIKAVTGEALIDLVFGGRLSLRAVGDRLEEPRAFARAVGVRLVGAGLGSVLSSLVPGRRSAPHSPVARRLEALRADARGVPLAVDTDIDQEQTLLTVLGVSIWAAVLPWLAGGEPVFAGALSLIALGFPAVFLFTRRTGKPARRQQAVR
ncbi:ATP-grasp domain-containing protein [Sphingopyxis fribergensis]